MLDRKSFPERQIDEKNLDEKVVDSPTSELDHGIVKDWDGEESAVTRK